MGLKRLVSQLKEALGDRFDVSDVEPEGPAKPTIKKPPPLPMAALKRGIKQPIKNKLPGIQGAPTKATSDAMSVFKKESAGARQTFARIIKEGRDLMEGGGSRMSKAMRQGKAQQAHYNKHGTGFVGPGTHVRNWKSDMRYDMRDRNYDTLSDRSKGIRHDDLSNKLATTGKMGPKMEGGGSRASKAMRQTKGAQAEFGSHRDPDVWKAAYRSAVKGVSKAGHPDYLKQRKPGAALRREVGSYFKHPLPHGKLP